LAFYFLGVPLCSSAGLYWIVLLENFVATWPLIIIAFFEAIVVCWVYGTDNFLDNIKWMTNFYPPIYLLWKMVWKFLCPIIFLTILTFVWLEYKPITYDGIVYPFWAIALGWTISASPILFILGTAFFMFCTSSGNVSERWHTLLCPEDDWGPALAVHRAEYYPLQIPEARRLMPLANSYAAKKPVLTTSPTDPALREKYDPAAESALVRRRRQDLQSVRIAYTNPGANEKETII